jgi:hypothetical protein
MPAFKNLHKNRSSPEDEGCDSGWLQSLLIAISCPSQPIVEFVNAGRKRSVRPNAGLLEFWDIAFLDHDIMFEESVRSSHELSWRIWHV